MAENINMRTWACERDDNDAAAPFFATLMIGEQLIASGHGVDEVTAYAALVDDLDRQGIADGSVLGMEC